MIAFLTAYIQQKGYTIATASTFTKRKLDRESDACTTGRQKRRRYDDDVEHAEDDEDGKDDGDSEDRGGHLDDGSPGLGRWRYRK